MSIFTHLFYLESRSICLEVVCEMEYEPGGGDGWKEPTYPAEVNLCSAKVGDVDITKALSDKDIESIEQEAFEENAAEQKEMAAERYFDDRNTRYDE